jgi:hypothetical protein
LAWPQSASRARISPSSGSPGALKKSRRGSASAYARSVVGEREGGSGSPRGRVDREASSKGMYRFAHEILEHRCTRQRST